ncbi:MAG: ribonuclease E/G, partial [Pseudomonadota bacterium]
MKGRAILLEPGRAALVVDGRLEDLLIDDPSGTPAPGAVFDGRVDRLMPGMGGAFVSLPVSQGFLRDAKGLREGDRLQVQVTGYAEPGKAIPVTRRLLWKGRYVILTPGAPGINISRRIKREEERARLTALVEGAAPGVILRSAAEDAPAEAIRADLSEVLAAEASGVHPTDAHAIARREWSAEIIEAHDAFDRLGATEQVARLANPEVPLPCGGSMIIEPTRALVAVDINTSGNGMTANVEACRDLLRQLRLRGLGGQIVLDPAPLKKAHRKKIEET